MESIKSQLKEANRIINTIRNKTYTQVEVQVVKDVFDQVYEQLWSSVDFEVLDNYIILHDYLIRNNT